MGRKRKKRRRRRRKRQRRLYLEVEEEERLGFKRMKKTMGAYYIRILPILGTFMQPTGWLVYNARGSYIR